MLQKLRGRNLRGIPSIAASWRAWKYRVHPLVIESSGLGVGSAYPGASISIVSYEGLFTARQEI